MLRSGHAARALQTDIDNSFDMSTPPLFTANATRVKVRRAKLPNAQAPIVKVPTQQDPVPSAMLGAAPIDVSPDPQLQPRLRSRSQSQPRPQADSRPAHNGELQDSSRTPEAYIVDTEHEARRSVGRSLKSMGSSAQGTPEHSVLILRMGYTQYLQRCLADGLVWKGSSPASEYAALGWRFSARMGVQTTERHAIPLPAWSPGDIPLYLHGARGPQPAASAHVNITDCRVYYTPVPATSSPCSLGVIAHYAVPMSILDEMERSVVGYNTFVHRLESPCHSGYSNLAVQMGSSPLVIQPARPLATTETEVDDWLAVQLEATHYGSTTLCCVPYLAPYVHVEGSLCKDTTCVSTLDRLDYRPVTSSGVANENQVLVPRLKVLCVVGQGPST